MKSARYYIKRASDMYGTAARMSQIANNEKLPLKLRYDASVKCQRAVELAAEFEELALQVQ